MAPTSPAANLHSQLMRVWVSDPSSLSNRPDILAQKIRFLIIRFRNLKGAKMTSFITAPILQFARWVSPEMSTCLNQFLSSGINDREDEYGGSLANRARFLLDVIQAIRAEVGSAFHLQVKISAIDYNNVVPWEKRGNTLADSVQVAKWCEGAGADAIHVSMGSLSMANSQILAQTERLGAVL